ncbi:DUF4352 domain-containing protein [Enterococcus casseliflavus]|jgi:hypothetical protein|uniref:DUF4352 domain-containing protein n=1 Tax=Enterococcus casseliflavus TaxID=37734 RepID=A0ABD6Z0W2_ENTCA|nr:DUF4352 domain-containing protein [Enterococcus casseliflavus]MBE9878394.1 DUF4352 domain-containing protein [Enterococcus casseliflavus]QGN29196.1 DUF4352 domain-containing protein [Enterococcus casseliflavus]DAR28414.1 MAG TPA: hypothetical protein [Caudoviricetes sp.]
MKKVHLGVFIGINLLLLSACSSPEDEKTVTQGSATAQTESIVESSAENTTESSTVESNNATVDRAEYSANFSEDWNGLTTNINKVVIVELSDDEIEMQGLENKYAVQVYFEITNNSDMDFDTYPDQATMVVEGQQIEAEMFLSDSIGGEILSGVTKEGIVTFSVPKIEDVSNVSNIRLKWSASYDTENYDEDNYKDFDVTFDLTK